MTDSSAPAAKRARPSAPSFVLRSSRVWQETEAKPACVVVLRGVIHSVVGYDAPPSEVDGVQVSVDDVGDLVVFPGLVDSHVHINEPGRTEWEGFETATKAAASGGITMLADMPLNSIPPTTTVDGLDAKIAAASGKLWVDVGFLGGIVPGNADQIVPLCDKGVLGFKAFLVNSGVDEFPHVTPQDLPAAIDAVKQADTLFMFHAEVGGPIESAKLAPGAEPTSYATYLATRPREAENEAIDLVLKAAREHGFRAHIVHLSSSDAVDAIREAQQSGAKVTAETCFHYLHFAAEDIPDGKPVYKCCPPIRERSNQDALWAALKEGVIQQVVSDHSPSIADLKCLQSGNLLEAWGGISSLSLALPIMWTECQKRDLGMIDMVRWLCSGPARLLGIEGRKGVIAPGADADFCIWDPAGSVVVNAQQMLVKNKLSPYDGEELSGRVAKTYVRGNVVFDSGAVSDAPFGDMVLRKK